MNVRYEFAAVGDAPQISRVYAESWRTAYCGLIPHSYLEHLSDDHWTEAFRSWIKTGELQVLLAREGGRMLGAVAFGPARETEFTGWGEIVSLYVRPECFGRGIGGALLEKAFQALALGGMSYVYLWVLEENRRARLFYEKFGLLCCGDSCECDFSGETVRDLRYIISLEREQTVSFRQSGKKHRVGKNDLEFNGTKC